MQRLLPQLRIPYRPRRRTQDAFLTPGETGKPISAIVFAPALLPALMLAAASGDPQFRLVQAWPGHSASTEVTMKYPIPRIFGRGTHSAACRAGTRHAIRRQHREGCRPLSPPPQTWRWRLSHRQARCQSKPKKRRAQARRIVWCVYASGYQITQRFLFTIGLPAGTLKACWNCGRLASVPFTR